MTGHIGDTDAEKEPKWVPMLKPNADFKVGFRGIKMNNHEMNGSYS